MNTRSFHIQQTPAVIYGNPTEKVFGKHGCKEAADDLAPSSAPRAGRCLPSTFPNTAGGRIPPSLVYRTGSPCRI